MRLKVDDDRGIVLLDSYAINAVLQSLSIGGSIIYEKKEDESSGKKLKVLSGYDDKKINIEMRILSLEDETPDYETLKKIENLFSKTDAGIPHLFIVDHPHIEARNIDQVIFSDLTSSENNNTGIIDIDLSFIEFIPAKYEMEKKGIAPDIDSVGNAETKDEKTNDLANKFIEGQIAGRNLF